MSLPGILIESTSSWVRISYKDSDPEDLLPKEITSVERKCGLSTPSVVLSTISNAVVNVEKSTTNRWSDANPHKAI